MRVLSAAALVILLVASPLQSQAPQPRAESSSRVARGRVLGPEGRALRGARVQIVAPPSTFEAVYSDETGNYAAPAPANTRYAVHVSKGGYVSQRLDAATLDAATPIRMARGAAVNGLVVDRFGDVGVGIGVMVSLVGGAPGSQEYVTQTDDRGEFRIGSLPAGRYAVQLTRGNVLFDDKTAALTIPLIDSYASTTPPRELMVRAGEEVSLDLVHDAGNDTVQRGAIAVASFERNQARSPGRSASPKEGTGVDGWVVDDRGRPARGAIVQLEPLTPGTPADPANQLGLATSASARRTSSDADGRYAFAGATPGRYVISTRRTESGVSPADVSRGSAQVIEIRAGDTVSVPLFVTRGSAIGGTVVDRYGEAVEGAMVQLRRVQFLQGRALLEPLRDVTVRLTDDRGHYRLPAVAPGQYYVVVQRDGLETYYPGRASLVEAAALRVDVGSDLLNVHVALQDAPQTRVFGVVNGATSNVEVILAESVRSGATVVRVRATLLAGGAFEFRRVPPGDYVLQVIERARPINGLLTTRNILMDTGITAFATQFVSVRGDAVGPVVITATRTGSLSGRLRFDPPSGKPLPPFVLAVVPSDPDRSPIDGPMSSILAGAAMPFAQAPSNPEGAFAIAGVAGPFRVTPLASNTRFWLKSAMVDGVNAVDDPVTITGGRSVSDVEVVMSGDAAMMEGRVTDPRVAVTPAMVLVFTTDSQRWFYGSQYVRRSRAARDGAFAIPGLPPGDYHVVAVDDLPEDESLTNLTSAELLSDLIPRARRVRVLPAARLSVELPMRSIR